MYWGNKEFVVLGDQLTFHKRLEGFWHNNTKMDGLVDIDDFKRKCADFDPQPLPMGDMTAGEEC